MHLNWLCCRLEKEISDRTEKAREKASVLMIIEFDNNMFIQVTILIDQEEKAKHLIDHYDLSLMFF
jgi:hypothetical protein